MKLQVDRQVLDLGLKIIGITITNLDNQNESIDFLNFKQHAYKALKKKYQDFDIETDLILRGFNQLHKKIKIKRHKNTPISENVLKRFLKEKLTSKNKLEHLLNIVCLDSRLCIFIHDMNKLDGDVTLQLVQTNKTYQNTSANKSVNIGEYMYKDSKDIICRLETKQSPKTLVTENTKNIFIVIEGNEATSAEYIMEVAEEIIYLITDYCKGNAQIIYK